VIPRGGWAYRRSQVVQHLVSCSRKPEQLPPAGLNTTADALIEHVLDELA
jgi:hypothetical protein